MSLTPDEGIRCEAEFNPILISPGNRFNCLIDEADENIKQRLKILKESDLKGTLDAEILVDTNVDGNELENCEESLERLYTPNSPRTDENQIIPIVNAVKLDPELLMTVKLVINSKTFDALVDTGASISLIRKSIAEKEASSIDTGNTVELKGLGAVSKGTDGKATLTAEMFKLPCVLDAHMTSDHNIKYPIILGRDFLRQEKIRVDPGRHKLTKYLNTGGKIDFYLESSGTDPVSVILECINVVAVEDAIMSKGFTGVKVELDCPNNLQYSDVIYYDGICHNKKLLGLLGIFNHSTENKTVLIKPETYSQEGGLKVRKGDIVGKVFSVVEMDDNDDETTLDLSEIINKLNIGDVTLEEREKVVEVIKRTNEAIGKSEYDIGHANVSPHVIELTDYTPIWQKPRRFPEAVNQEIENQCEELKLMDIIEYSDSDFSAPVVPVKKKDNSLRMCVDYRKLNKVTKPQNCNIPNLTDSVYSATKIKYFSKLDLIKGFYQVPISENSRKYTAFSTLNHQYQFKRLSFGLKNSGIQFQKNMQEILADFKNKKVIVYIDDILIMSESFDEHLILVEKVLTTLMNSGIKVKIDKCEFFKQQVEFLGHIISKDGISKSPEFIEKVKNFERPTNVSQLRQFLGLCNFQRKFVEHFSEIAKPLTSRTSGPKKKVLDWTEDMLEAFNILKDKLAEEVRLAFPDYSPNANKLELYVDASSFGAGACLIQLQNDEYRVIAYNSLSFSPAQQRYCTLQKELLAIKFGVKSLRSFLFGIEFILYTDHRPLLYLHNMARDNARIMRTIGELDDYNFVIKYKPGPENVAADALSRMVQRAQVVETDSPPESYIPPGFCVAEKVEGGGDSMFQSVFVALENAQIHHSINLPDNVNELRTQAVEHLVTNFVKLGIPLDKERLKIIKSMRYPGVLPTEDLLLAAAALYNIEIRVFHAMVAPVVFKPRVNTSVVIYLQCLAGIHYNPLIQKKKQVEVLIVEKLVHVPADLTICETNKSEVEVLANVQMECNSCHHQLSSDFTCTIEVENQKFCVLFDTGAQVSVMSAKMLDALRTENPELNYEDGTEYSIKGITDAMSAVIGIVQLYPKMLGIDFNVTVPIAVVEDECMPCCIIFGMNFIKRNNIVLDFDKNYLYACNFEDEEIIYPFNDKFETETAFVHTLETVEHMLEEFSEEEDEFEDVPNVVFSIRDNNFHNIQKNDHALRNLYQKIKKNVSVKHWDEEYLKKFRRYQSQMCIEDGLLIRVDHNKRAIILPFALIVDIVHKVHTQMCHIGRLKLFSVVSEKFWQPSLGKNVRRYV